MKAAVRANWGAVILVCRKCSKKLDGGFGPDGTERLAKALRRATGGGKGRKAGAGIVEVDCLDICPKGAVVVVDAARPGDWLLVKRGTPVGDVAERLGMANNSSPSFPRGGGPHP